jgi:hypothetical protein
MASVAALAALVSLGPAAVAHAEFRVDAFDVTNAAGVAGADPNQAGGHPDLNVSATFGSGPAGDAQYAPNDGHVRKVVVDLPAGISGNPNAVPRCTAEQFELSLSFSAACPVGSQVGLLRVSSEYQHSSPPDTSLVPLFALDPLPGETARLGTSVTSYPVTISISPRPGDLGLRATVNSTPGGSANPWFVGLTLWGIPADSSHDLDRLNAFGFPLTTDPNTGDPAPTPSQAPRLAFLSNATSCTPPSTATVSATSYENSDAVVTRTADTAYPTPTGCDREAFDPSVSVRPTDTRPDTPSGYDISLTVPQQTNADAPGSSHVRTVDLTLPPGVVISPAGASGLDSCNDEQLGLGADGDTACPDASRIGSASFDVPILPGSITGAVYLRKPLPGHLFRLALVASGYGVKLKIPGEVTPDPVTGQLHAVFDNAPQQPFSGLTLRFDGGPRAPLANPESCGTVTAAGSSTGWNGKVASLSDSFTIADPGGSSCAGRGFLPSLRAGTSLSQAGAAAPLVLDVARKDGEQDLRQLDVQLPPGLTAKVAGVPLCGSGDAAAGTCGDGSLVGSTTVGAGSGSQPLYLPGRVYLTAGYGGAPYGLSIVVPAKVGPFDLGNVIVQAKVYVDRTTAALRVISEPLPTIVQGIPLRIKEIRIAIDRPNFILNPTNCGAKSIVATVTSTDGATAAPASSFAATGCKALPFKPALTISTSGKKYKGSGGSLTVGIKSPVGQANLGAVSVRLPLQLAARASTLRTLCSSAQWAAQTCPPSTISGTASATTPILPEPLKGSVYFVTRSNGADGLPQLRTILRGNGLEIELTGDVKVGKDGYTNTTFPAIPDVPITGFSMDLPQGPHSLLDVNGNLCNARPLSMKTTLGAQSGVIIRGSTKVTVTSCKKASKAKAKTAKKAKPATKAKRAVAR